MNAAEQYGGKSDILCRFLNDSVLLALAAPSTPEEVRQEIEARAVAERTTADLLRLGMAEGRTRMAIKADVRAHVDRLAAIMQPSIDLAKRYAAAMAEDLA